MVGAEFARIDEVGRLTFSESPSKEKTKADQLACTTSTIKSQTSTIKSQTPTIKSQTDAWQFPASTSNVKPSLPLGSWLDYYQAKNSAQAALEKLQSRRDNGGLKALLDKEPAGHLHNSIFWLDRVAGAVTLLQEMRKEHIASLQSDCVLPVGRAPSALLAEWSGSEAVDILAEALPELVDQVELYEDSLVVRGRRNRDEDELRLEVSQLQEQLKSEKRQKEYYWRKLREHKQVGATSLLGFGAGDNDAASSVDNDIAMYSEKDMKAGKKDMLAKLEAMDKDWQEKFDAEQQKAWDLQAKLRLQIEELRKQIEALQKLLQSSGNDQSSIRSHEPVGTAASNNVFAAGGPGANASGKGRQREVSSDRPQDTALGSLHQPQDAVLGGHGTGFRQTGEKAGVVPDTSPLHPGAVSSSSANAQADGKKLAVRPRPKTAPGSALRPDRPFTNRFDPGPSGDEQRRRAEELKRRMFESVLAEERKRQAEMDELEEDALAARWELQGQSELTQLIRRIDDIVLRRDIFRQLKSYCKRSPMAMEIVCVYCRRKPRPEQIHSFETPSRPGSAHRTAGHGPSIVCAPQTHKERPSTALPRVSSSPSVIMGTQNGIRVFEDAPPFGNHLSKAETKRSRAQKLMTVMPAGSTLTATPGVSTTLATSATSLDSLLQAPTGSWNVDAAC